MLFLWWLNYKKMYPTDLSETQWQFIKKTLQLNERKRKHNLRSVWNAVLYLVKTGCQWRMLPSNFAKWQLVYYYYKKWSVLDCFDLLLAKLREKVRVGMGAKQAGKPGHYGQPKRKMGKQQGLERV